jgi:hypothetical protein
MKQIKRLSPKPKLPKSYMPNQLNCYKNKKNIQTDGRLKLQHRASNLTSYTYNHLALKLTTLQGTQHSNICILSLIMGNTS